MILTDTHSHLYSDKFSDDRDAMMQRCFDAGVQRIFLPNIDSTSIKGMLELKGKYPENIFPMMGLHPCHVKENYKEELDIAHKWLQKGGFVAVGEIGIDLYWDKTTLGIQIDAFKTQCEWAKELGLPIIIHARDSFDEIFEVLDEINDERLKGIFHCFTGTVEQGERVLNYNDFFLGIGGVVTFKKAGLDKTVAQLPLDKLVLETDSPYLAPTPYRGKRNETAYITHIAAKIAEMHDTSIERVAEITTQNSVTIFGV
jgi:TatD DNase family protein